MTNLMLASFMTVLLWADVPLGYSPSLLSSPPRTTTVVQDAVAQGAMTQSAVAQGMPTAVGGSQMIIDGQVVPIAWVQWQVDGMPRLAINEQQLMQYFGVDLRDTDQVGVQPVQWFSDPATTPLPLSARLYQGVRYLDITPLIQQFGWQVSGQGSTLQLTLPPSQVTEVRQGQRQIGSRTVIQLSQPALWQATQEEQMLLVTVNATATPRLVSQLRPTPGNLVKDALRHRSSSKLSTTMNRTVIRLPIPANTSPQIATLPDPARIVIDFRPDAMVNRNILWAPGLRWRQQYITIGSGRFPIIWLEVDPRQPGLQLRPIWSSASTI
ncbi:MAG: hypothetical protein NZ772_19295, partial [Cyanobacteria bacterium]|nr:hypothetical protein [Cyanobacteriota bacterium]MDW8203341.1 hypothetical protein [Cyanobacteriota bacterium SKYGB_h_bin112]